jgi:hypothetical protein
MSSLTAVPASSNALVGEASTAGRTAVEAEPAAATHAAIAAFLVAFADYTR